MDRRGFLGLVSAGLVASLSENGLAVEDISPANKDLVLWDGAQRGRDSALGTAWEGFSDRVMGGVSTASFRQDTIANRPCLRLTGQVTRDSGGGFIQAALYLAQTRQGFDASAFSGLEIDVYGNEEEYNAHLRSRDVRWYEQSYRATFFAPANWSTIRLPWTSFVPHNIDKPLDTGHLIRFGLLGWMREFEADLAIGRVSLFV